MHRYGVTPCFSATACSARRVRLHVLLRAAAETAAEPQRVRRVLGPQIAQGVPFGQYMHELHALPALLPLAQACGALSVTRVAAHTPGPWGVIAMAASFGLAWTFVMEINRAATGAFPYSFLLQQSLPQRAMPRMPAEGGCARRTSLRGSHRGHHRVASGNAATRAEPALLLL